MTPSGIQALKLHLVYSTGLSKDALHIYVGLIVFFLSAILFRKPLRAALPLTMVSVAALAGEAVDAWDDIASAGHWQVGASVHDMLNTMFWPVILCLLAKFTKVLR